MIDIEEVIEDLKRQINSPHVIEGVSKDTIKALEKQQARIGKLEEALEWHIDDEPCRFDHNDNCQEHFCFEGKRTCYMQESKELLKTLPKPPEAKS